MRFSKGDPSAGFLSIEYLNALVEALHAALSGKVKGTGIFLPVEDALQKWKKLLSPSSTKDRSRSPTRICNQ